MQVLTEETEEIVTNDKRSEAHSPNEKQHQFKAEEQKVENKKNIESVDEEGKGEKAGAAVEISPLDIKPPTGQAAAVTVSGLPSPSAHLSLFGIAENSKPVERTEVKEESFDKKEEKKDSVEEKEESVEEKEQSFEEMEIVEELKKEPENEKDEKNVSEAASEAEPETKGTLAVNDLPGEEVMTDKETADDGSNEAVKVVELTEEPKTTQETKEQNEKEVSEAKEETEVAKTPVENYSLGEEAKTEDTVEPVFSEPATAEQPVEDLAVFVEEIKVESIMESKVKNNNKETKISEVVKEPETENVKIVEEPIVQVEGNEITKESGADEKILSEPEGKSVEEAPVTVELKEEVEEKAPAPALDSSLVVTSTILDAEPEIEKKAGFGFFYVSLLVGVLAILITLVFYDFIDLKRTIRLLEPEPEPIVEEKPFWKFF